MAVRPKVQASLLNHAQRGVLLDIALLLNNGESIDALFERVAGLLEGALDFDYVGISLLTEGTRVRLVGARPPLCRPVGSEFDLGEATVARLTSSPSVSAFTTAAADPWTAALAAVGIRHSVMAALRDGSRLLGTFTCGRNRDEPCTEAELEFIRLLGMMLSESMAAYRRTEVARVDSARNRLLNEVALLVNAGQSAARFFDRLRQLLSEAIPLDSMALLVSEPDGLNLRVVGTLRSRTVKRGALIPVTAVLPESPATVGNVVTEHLVSTLDSPIARTATASGVQRLAVAVLRDGPHLLGVLSLGRHADRAFTAGECDLLNLLATFLGQSLANEKRMAATETEAARASLLNQLGLLLNAGEDVASLFDRLPPMLRRAVDFDYVGIAVDAGRPGFLKALDWNSRESVNAEPAWVTRDSLQLDTLATSSGSAFQLRMEPEAQAPGTLASEFARAGVRRSAFFLLGPPGSPLGVLHLARARTDRFSALEMAFLEVVATFFSQAVANQLRVTAALAEAQEQRILAEVAGVAARETDPLALLNGLVEPIRALVPRPWVAYGHLDADCMTWPGPGGDLSFPLNDNIRQALELGQQVGPLSQLDPNDPTSEAGITLGSYTASFAGGVAVGLLYIATREPGHVFDGRELRIFKLIAQIIGPAMENVRSAKLAQVEAEEQRVIADVAAAAAVEVDPNALVGSLQALRRLIPRPFAAFGYLEGDELIFPVPHGTVQRWPMDRASYAALKRGQISSAELPDHISPDSMLWSSGVHALSHTVARSGGIVVGFLLVGSRQEGFVFQPRDLRILATLAQIIGPAMANIRASQRTLAEAQEQRILAEVAAVAARETDPVTLLNGLVGPLRVLVPRPWLAYGHLDGGRMVWPTPAGELVLRLNDDVQQALDLGQQVGVLSLLEPHHPTRDAGITLGSYTASFAGGVAIGVLYIATREPGHTFGERELRLFKLIAQIVGPAMENVRSAKRAQIEAEEQRVLAEVATAAARGSTIAEVIGSLAGTLGGVVPGAFAIYGRLSEETIIYDTVAADVAPFVSSDELQLPLSANGREARATGYCLGSWAWTRGDEIPPTWASPPDIRLGTVRRIGRGLGLHQYCLVPYSAAGAPVGMLMVASTDPGHVFSPAHIALLGRVVRIVGPAIEAVRAATNVARQSELNGLILRSLTESVILLDRDANVVFTNPSGAALLEAINPGGKARGFEEFTLLLPEATRADVARAVTGNIASSGRTSMVVNGLERWVDYELVPVDGDPYRLLVVTSEVTAAVRREAEQQKQRERLEQASRLVALGELVGGVAHELNNPLTAVLGFSEMLSLAPEAASLGEEIGIIRKEALRARNIVRDLLFIARPAPVDHSVVAMTDVIGHIERLRRPAWAHAAIEVEIDIDLGGSLVWGNENQLAQVFLNLVTNAEQAIGDRGGFIRIVGRRRGQDVCVAVSDTGSGMPRDVVERVFEPFFSTKQSAGTGLGLSLSRSMVLSHQGTISVESNPGIGTTFTVTLPVYAAAPVSAPFESQADGVPTHSAAADSQAVRVLVIDDEPNLRKLCQRLIISMGHRCSVAQDSATALALASADDFDLVLCDYRLASESADTVIAGFAQHAPHLIERTVVATGATNDAGVLDLVARFGLRLIAKPYGSDEIADEIAHAALLRG
ncbi:MAG: ATP-binding protein [Anaerolineaceae bacterium]